MPATEGYEQYRLNLMYTEKKLQPYICPFYNEYLCNSKINIQSFTLHFFGFKRNIVDVFNSIIIKSNI